MTKNWTYPSFRKELGEIERVASHFGLSKFVENFLAMETICVLTDLTEEVWGKLENTQSFIIKKGDWVSVRKYATEKEVPRNWKKLKRRMCWHLALQAPIIFKRNGQFHLVSGNTRLMVAHALGITPKVVIVELR